MTQLIVSLEDGSMLNDVKRAIKMLRGVVSVKESKVNDYMPNPVTLKAIDELENGQTVVCSDFNEYLKLVNSEFSD